MLSHFLHIYTQAGKMTTMMTFNYRAILFSKEFVVNVRIPEEFQLQFISKFQ